MDIRVMTTDDYDGVYSLWTSCKGVGLNNLDDSKEGIDRYLKRNPDTCFIACDKEKIIGVIISGHDGRRGYIYHTAVNPEYRKQGIGSQLVDAALDALKKNGINKVALVAFSTNDTGNKFWENMNFTVREDLVYRNRMLTDMIKYI